MRQRARIPKEWVLSGEGGLTHDRYRWDFSHVHFRFACNYQAWRYNPPARSHLPPGGAVGNAIRLNDPPKPFSAEANLVTSVAITRYISLFTRSKLLTGTSGLCDL